jgi:hypothetical protein
MSPCAACTDKRVHTPADWAHHPYAGHGFNGSVWTHPDLAGAGPSSWQISGEVVKAEAVPAGGES